jgi:hypothetical protein
MLLASGLPKQLGIAPAIPEDINSKIILLDLIVGEASDKPMKTTRQELAATKLRKYIDQCLGTEGYQLTDDGKSKLLQLVTEMLDNAEQHSRTDDRWHVIAYFSRMEAESGGICHIAIFNFGDSISQSLRHSDADEIKREIKALASFHRNKNWFGLSNWKDEVLWTLYALQQGITRFAGTAEGQLRGNGTVTMIEFFEDLAGPGARMCLVSGSAYVLFDGTHRLTEGRRGTSDVRWKVIAFNDLNDLYVPPDGKYVHALKDRFPGTVVSLRFQIEASYLELRKAGPVCQTEK